MIATFMHHNMLLESYGGPPFLDRLAALERLYRSIGPSFASWNECDRRQADLICNRLGWDHAAADADEGGAPEQYVRIGWQKAKWDHLDVVARRLPGTQGRRAVFVLLRRRDSGALIWAGSTHLSVKTPKLSAAAASKERGRQSHMIARVVREARALCPAPIVMGADLNAPYPDAPGTLRRILRNEAKLVGIRTQGAVQGARLASWQGFRATKTGGWIDDVMSRDCRLTDGRLVTTTASDHNAIACRVTWKDDPR